MLEEVAMLRMVSAIGAFLMVGVLSPLRADLIDPVNYAVVVSDAGNGQGCGTQNAYGGFMTLFPASCAFTDGAASISGTAEAFAPDWYDAQAYATLQVSGSGPVSGNLDVYATSFALSTWTNTYDFPAIVSFTVTADPPTGGGLYDSVYPNPAVSVGVVSGCMITGVGNAVGLIPDENSVRGEGAYGPGGSTPQAACETTIPAGETFEIFVGGSTEVTAGFADYGFVPFTGTVNYLGSMEVTSLTVTDTSGDPISPSGLVGSDGPFQAPVPEPNSIFLLGGALLLLGLRSKRMRRHLDRSDTSLM
jgi:PEP-CTERM motif